MVNASLVLYHNPKTDIDRLLDCVLRSCIGFLFIVDHSETDEFGYLESISDRVRYTRTANHGYGTGHNLGFRLAQEVAESRYHIVLNPDVYFEPSAISAIVEYMETHPQVGQLMPEILYPDGRHQQLCKLLPTPCDIIVHYLAPAPIRRRHDRRYYLNTEHLENELEVPYIAGCFMFFRSECFRTIDGFDPRFFMYFEDNDITRRMGTVARTVYFPGAKVFHSYNSAYRYSLKMLRASAVSAVRYFSKWGWLVDPQRRRINEQTLSQISEMIHTDRTH